MTIKERLNDLTDAMKNRIAEIYEAITGEVAADVELGVDSQSSTAEWGTIAKVIAFAGYEQEELFDQAKEDIEAVRETGVSANKKWFYNEWKGFQYGDALLVDDTTGKYYYAVIDATKQIVLRLSISNNLGGWEVRVAKDDGNGNPVAMSAAELNAFEEFVDMTAPPGPKIPVISRNSDKVKAYFTIYYNPIYSLDNVKAAVEAAYLAYLEKIDIEGESVYYITKHQDELQSALGVVDVKPTDVQAKIDGEAYAVVDRKYTPFSGYLEKDAAINFDSLLTYIAE